MSQIMGINAKVIEQMKKQKGKSECLPWDFVKKYLTKCEDNERVCVCHGRIWNANIFESSRSHRGYNGWYGGTS